MTLITVLSVVFCLSAHAQGSSGSGGGDPTAADFQTYVNKIDAYLLTDEGKMLFPEIKQPEFHEMAKRVRPVVKDERVYDSFGIAQTCVSHVDTTQRYFQCDLQRLPKIELDTQPTFYRLTFHELLFQVGKELPQSPNVPSSFAISSRLSLHLETFRAWVPGASKEMIAPVENELGRLPSGSRMMFKNSFLIGHGLKEVDLFTFEGSNFPGCPPSNPAYDCDSYRTIEKCTLEMYKSSSENRVIPAGLELITSKTEYDTSHGYRIKIASNSIRKIKCSGNIDLKALAKEGILVTIPAPSEIN